MINGLSDAAADWDPIFFNQTQYELTIRPIDC